jgi:hypothetical protein
MNKPKCTFPYLKRVIVICCIHYLEEAWCQTNMTYHIPSLKYEKSGKCTRTQNIDSAVSNSWVQAQKYNGIWFSL